MYLDTVDLLTGFARGMAGGNEDNPVTASGQALRYQLAMHVHAATHTVPVSGAR